MNHNILYCTNVIFLLQVNKLLHVNNHYYSIFVNGQLKGTEVRYDLKREPSNNRITIGISQEIGNIFGLSDTRVGEFPLNGVFSGTNHGINHALSETGF